MKITKRILLSIYFIVLLFIATIIVNMYSHKKILQLTGDTEQAVLVYSKWSQFTNKTIEFLYATSDQNKKYSELKSALQDFDDAYTVLIASDHFKSMGYEVEGIIEQINGLWGFYRTIIFDLTSDIESSDGAALLNYLSAKGKSIHSFSGTHSSSKDKNLKLANKINSTMSYRRNDSPETSAQSDFNWLINHNFIPLIKEKSNLLSNRISIFSVTLSVLGILFAGLITIILAGSIKKPIDLFIEIFKRGAYGDFSVRFPLKKSDTDSVPSKEKCYNDSGSFSAAFGIPVKCPEIISGRIRDCDTCPVYKEQNRDEITMLGTWFNILMTNLEHSVNSINNAKNIWQKNQEATLNIHRNIYPAKASENFDVSFYASTDNDISPLFHDFYFVDNSLRGFGIFGLKSEGISSALMTTIAKSLIYRLFSRMHAMPLEKIAKSINSLINEEIGEKDSISGTIIKLDDVSAEFSNTGFGRLIFIRKNVAENISRNPENSVKSIAFGIDGYNTDFPIKNLPMQKGDILLLFSTGSINEINISSEITEKISNFSEFNSSNSQDIVNLTAEIISGKLQIGNELKKTIIIAVKKK